MFFFFNDTATTEIYTLSLHDALPICIPVAVDVDFHDFHALPLVDFDFNLERGGGVPALVTHLEFLGLLLRVLVGRSEEHTSELQSRQYLVCRLLLEKKKNKTSTNIMT